VTDADAVVLEWDQQTRRRTMPLVPGAQNVDIMRSAVVTPQRFNAFCALLDGTGALSKGSELPHCFHSHEIPPDDEEEASTASEGATTESSAAPSAPSASEGVQLGASVGASTTRTSPANGSTHGDTHASTLAPTAEAPQTMPILVKFGLEDLPDDEQNDSVKLDKPQDELMCQHIRLGHLPILQVEGSGRDWCPASQDHTLSTSQVRRLHVCQSYKAPMALH
jgi:hypothetical protein